MRSATPVGLKKLTDADAISVQDMLTASAPIQSYCVNGAVAAAPNAAEPDASASPSS